MPDGTVYPRPNLARSVTFSLRLNPEELAAVQDLAAERHTPSDMAMVVERREADLRTLRKLVAP